MSAGMVISDKMVASFLQNRPFTRSLSGKKTLETSQAQTLNGNKGPSEEPARNFESDTDLLTSFGEDALPSPGALHNSDGLPQFLGDISPSPKWDNLMGKSSMHSEWPLPGGLGEELPSLFDGHTSFLPRPDTDANMMETEEGINGSVEQTQPPPPADTSMGDVDNGNVDIEGAENGGPGAAESFLSSLFDWDKLGSTPTPNKDDSGQSGASVKPKAPSPAMRFTRSRSFELRKMVEQKGYCGETVMKAIDEGKVDPATVWAKAAAENAAASRPSQQDGVDTGQGQKERGPVGMEELKRLVNRNMPSTVPIRSGRSPASNPLSYLSPRLRDLLDAQLPDTPSPSTLTQSDSAKDDRAGPKPSAPAMITVPLNQPRHRGRPQPLKGLTSAQKIEPLKPAHSDPGGLSKKRGLSTEMLPPVKRTLSTGNPGPSGISDNGIGRSGSSISEIVRAYSETRTANKPPSAPKAAEPKRKGRAEKEPKQQRKGQQTAQAPVATAAAVPAAAPAVPSADTAHIQLQVKAQKAEQLEEENRGLKQYLTFLSKKDGLQMKLIEQLEQQLMRVTEERNKLLAAAKKR